MAPRAPAAQWGDEAAGKATLVNLQGLRRLNRTAKVRPAPRPAVALRSDRALGPEMLVMCERSTWGSTDVDTVDRFFYWASFYLPGRELLLDLIMPKAEANRIPAPICAFLL
jgi:hypothetical protein